ncbi:hypothetical protein PYW08_010066 [Mythimna loreyi]|uniref:Uncharacterized protein n=1 Tax=Mythimna loreyi TaxID=667449 RepID=A0ACC2Q794_9NEOP|nr:hypothetical protein PYW08_010066 [Mythimna loreyi]
MSVPEQNKAIIIKNESAHSEIVVKKENSNPTVDMDSEKKETVTPGSATVAKSKEIICIDMENSVETRIDVKNPVPPGPIVNLSELTAHVISERAAHRKLTVKGLYQYMLGYGKQQHAPRPIWNVEQPSLQPEQAVWMQYGPTQLQVPPQNTLHNPLQNPLHDLPKVQDPVQTPGTKITQAQGGYYQGGGGYGGGGGYPQQQQGYYQQQGYGGGNQGYGQGYPDSGYDDEPPPRRHRMPGEAQSAGELLEYDPKERNSFVRLVMGLVFLMLALTAGFVAYVYTTPNLAIWFLRSTYEVLIPALVLILISYYCLVCSPCGRVCPGNMICLIFTVVGYSLIAALITCRYRTQIILYAFIATAAMVLVCLLLACSSFDFTSYALYIIGIAVAFSVIACLIYIGSAITGTMMKPVHIGLLLVGTLIQVVVLIMELQMVLGGRAIEISETDYALAAWMLYTSIIDIFLKMVQLLGLFDS